MSSVLDRDALSESPLADLHLLANELGVDGFRRLRRDDLIDPIIARQAGQEPAWPRPQPRGGAGRGAEAEAEGEEAPRKPRRGRRGGRGRSRRGDVDEDEAGGEPERGPEPEDRVVEGVVELLGNGSAFVRLTPGESSDDDVYVSAAQVKRCELVSGDRIAGPMRTPRRSERFPSLVRVDTINARPAEEVAEGTRFEDLPATFPTERLELGSEDPTVNAVEWLTPFGKGSRVVVCGPALSGKSDLLRRIAGSLAGREGLEVSVVLAGVRPEEIAEWGMGPVPPVG